MLHVAVVEEAIDMHLSVPPAAVIADSDAALPAAAAKVGPKKPVVAAAVGESMRVVRGERNWSFFLVQVLSCWG